MRADVAAGAEFAAFTGEEAPVVVGVLEQPVLEEMALDVNDLAEFAARHHRARLEHGGKEAAHVVHGEDGRSCPLHGGDNLRGVARVHAERLFAHDVFAGGERGEGLLDVRLVRGGDVDDIDVRRAEHRAVVVVAIDLGDAPFVRRGLRVPGRAADGGDLDAESFEGFNVNRADETGADDTGAKLMQRFDHIGCAD